MGRKLAFNREQALHKAMESFWAKGYKKTSMRDLAERLELHLGSVYNSLGTKEAVFEESLRLYFEGYIHPNLQKMKAHAEPLAAIEHYFKNALVHCTSPENGSGCFVVNSLHEITQINNNITSFVHEMFRREEEAFASVVAAGQRLGQIDPLQDAQKTGRCLVATLISMFALSRMSLPAEHIRQIADAALAQLKPKD